jgi:hypothetical protein
MRASRHGTPAPGPDTIPGTWRAGIPAIAGCRWTPPALRKKRLPRPTAQLDRRDASNGGRWLLGGAAGDPRRACALLQVATGNISIEDMCQTAATGVDGRRVPEDACELAAHVLDAPARDGRSDASGPVAQDDDVVAGRCGRGRDRGSGRERTEVATGSVLIEQDGDPPRCSRSDSCCATPAIRHCLTSAPRGLCRPTAKIRSCWPFPARPGTVAAAFPCPPAAGS